jgi:hypothetical protein
VTADLARIAYEASLRTLDKQDELLQELRSRTGLLLAASSLAASFLGEPALDEGSRPVAVTALAAFAVSVLASLYVLFPRRDLVTSLAGPTLYERLFEFATDTSEVHRRLAYDLDRFWESNDRTVRKLIRGFGLAIIALGIEVLLLLGSVTANLV